MQTLNLTKEYRCLCGKIFDNPQSFNGHKSHCRIHRLAKGGEENYNNYLVKQAKASAAAQQAHKANFEAKCQADLAVWLNAKHICEHCGKVMTEKFGSGRFCSRACANSRVHTESTKQKIRDSLDSTFVKQHKNPPRPKKTCFICGCMIKSYNKTGLCRNCLDHTSTGSKVRQELGRKGYITKQERGTHVGWQSRKVTSYAEKFWIQVLDNNDIPYEREFLIACNSTRYFLDFRLARHGRLIDLEIDGKQHKYEDRALADIIRDNNLQALGYIVYRIPWNEVKSKAGADEMKEKIDAFLAFYNSL